MAQNSTAFSLRPAARGPKRFRRPRRTAKVYKLNLLNWFGAKGPAKKFINLFICYVDLFGLFSLFSLVCWLSWLIHKKIHKSASQDKTTSSESGPNRSGLIRTRRGWNLSIPKRRSVQTTNWGNARIGSNDSSNNMVLNNSRRELTANLSLFLLDAKTVCPNHRPVGHSPCFGMHYKGIRIWTTVQHCIALHSIG